MTPLSKCVSLETAKRLLAAGFPQETERWWLNPFKEQGWRLVDEKQWDRNAHHEFVAAPCATEIDHLLPAGIDDIFYLHVIKVVDGWIISYEDMPRKLPLRWHISVVTTNQAEALAEAYLSLKENNLI